MLIDQQDGDILSLSVILEGRLDYIRLCLYHGVSSAIHESPEHRRDVLESTIKKFFFC